MRRPCFASRRNPLALCPLLLSPAVSGFALFAHSVGTMLVQLGTVKAMNNNGFGFSFHLGGEDEHNDRNGGHGSNGNGGLGDMLNQFGQMLSGMGSTMNSPDAKGPVNYALAERIARQQIGSAARTSEHDRTAVTEAVRLAELWIDAVTIWPAASNAAEAWGPTEWLEQTLPMWKRLTTPVAKQMQEAQVAALPEEAREMVGQMLSMMGQMSSMNYGMQLGNALSDLATQVVSGSDLTLPVAPAGKTALLPSNLAKHTKHLGIPAQEVLVYASAREAARQRLLTHVPWLSEQLVASVEEYAAGLVIDTSHAEEAMRELNLESGDPASIQDAMQRLQGADLSPKITSNNAGAASRLQTLLALIEGWVDVVVQQALGERLGSTDALHQAWQRRRETGGSSEQAFSKVVGIEIAAPEVDKAAELWRRVDTAVGTDRRDHLWDHPDLLPTAEDLQHSAAFIDGLLADDFDPIAEITSLEAELEQAEQTDASAKEPSAEDRREANKERGKADDTPKRNADSTTSEKAEKADDGDDEDDTKPEDDAPGSGTPVS